MKQLGNLAIICAQRKSVQLQVRNGMASVLVDTGTDRAVLSAHWDNDAEIKQIIYELNFGKYRENEKVCASESDDPKSADTLWDLLLRHKNHQVADLGRTDGATSGACERRTGRGLRHQAAQAGLLLLGYATEHCTGNGRGA